MGDGGVGRARSIDIRSAGVADDLDDPGRIAPGRHNDQRPATGRHNRCSGENDQDDAEVEADCGQTSART